MFAKIKKHYRRIKNKRVLIREHNRKRKAGGVYYTPNIPGKKNTNEKIQGWLDKVRDTTTDI